MLFVVLLVYLAYSLHLKHLICYNTLHSTHVSTLCFHLRSSPIGVYLRGAYTPSKTFVREIAGLSAGGGSTRGVYRRRNTAPK